MLKKLAASVGIAAFLCAATVATTPASDDNAQVVAGWCHAC